MMLIDMDTLLEMLFGLATFAIPFAFYYLISAGILRWLMKMLNGNEQSGVNVAYFVSAALAVVTCFTYWSP
ncbi:hypothetical protein [Zobellella aerophila]|uniref:DUF1656 domain-containing protein n=1 Tax=Zobellella aerophila TaxID=870480 RepID=A0ABP6WFP4_9GAMM